MDRPPMVLVCETVGVTEHPKPPIVEEVPTEEDTKAMPELEVFDSSWLWIEEIEVFDTSILD